MQDHTTLCKKHGRNEALWKVVHRRGMDERTSEEMGRRRGRRRGLHQCIVWVKSTDVGQKG